MKTAWSDIATKRLRIVHTEASCGWGGQEIRVLTESKGMIDRGHQVEIWAPLHSKIFAESTRRGIPCTALEIEHKSIKGVFAVRAALASARPDVVNTHSSNDSWLVALARLILSDPPPVVRTRHISAPVPRNAASRWLYTRATNHVVTTGESLRHELIRGNGFASMHVSSVPTGIDLSRFTPGDRALARQRLNIAPTAEVVGICATLRSWKGHLYLTDAFAQLRRPNARLLIVGDGPMRAALEQRVTERGVSSSVVFAGNQVDIVPYLHAMDVFTLPSYANEGVPQALMQAMACGLPVVSTPVGAISEIIDNGTTGILVPPRDAGSLSLVLDKLLDNAALRAELGARAAAVAKARFGLAPMLDRMEQIFRQVCA